MGDVVAIKLPLAICGNEGNDDSLQCLSPGAQKLLNNALFRYVAAGYLKVGLEFANMQPGSSLLLLKEYRVNGDYWQRRFFCEDWVATGGKFNFKRWRLLLRQCRDCSSSSAHCAHLDMQQHI